jgi:ferredoxin
MIIAERKPMEEIKQLIAPYKKVLVAGCGTCVTVCWAGGEKEVAMLASQLRLARSAEGSEIVVLVAEIKDKVAEVDAVLSLACGSGVQTMAEMFEDKPVFPGVNTTFIGMPEKEGLWVEMCGACGDCFLDRTGGVCPIVRCAKGLLNGPCGGTRKGGKCEIDPEKDCAWVLIYRRLEKQGRLDVMRKYYAPKNYRAVKRPGKVQAAKA